jgi:glucose/arabinose dehydrogenase/mono/diheme cytochrome c family protein
MPPALFPASMKRAIFVISFISILCPLGSLHAQRGDRKGQQQPEVWKDMDVPAAPRRTAEEQLGTFRLAPGFEVQLVASEPMVETPVVLNWDANGRLWVVEMRAYMPNVDGIGEDVRTGRISVLEDLDGDGKMDKVTRFLENLQMPRAIAFVKGGVLVAEPPELLFCQDLDGDLKCDKKEPVASYGKQDPVEHTENGLMPALDNWIYNAKSGRRFQFVDGKIIEEKTSGRGQWGIAQDNFGRLYANGNSSWLHADTTPPGYKYRNPNYEIKSGFMGKIVGSSEIFSIRVNPGINRGYQDNMLLKDGRLARVTAISGPTIYRGGQFPPEYVGSAFVPEPSANAVGLWYVIDEGTKLTTEHATFEDPNWGKREFLASTDERFRPVSLYSGPDGCLYVCDMYRGILQHKAYVTSFLRKQIIERGLDKHIDTGRIWRVIHKASPSPQCAPKLEEAKPGELVGYLSHANGTVRDTAQRLLVQAAVPKSVEPLRKVALGSDDPLARIHALWTLQGMGELSTDVLYPNFRHQDPKVRQQALRCSDRLVTKDAKLQEAVLNLAKQEEDKATRFQAELTLANSGNLAHHVGLLTSGEPSGQVVDAILSGIHGREARLLGESVSNPSLEKDKKQFESLFKALGLAIHTSSDVEQNQILLATMASTSTGRPWIKDALLSGILTSKGKAVQFPVKPIALDLLEDAGKLAKKYTWKGDTRILEPDGKPLTPEDHKRFLSGKLHYTTTCMPCHQADGLGQPAVAPPLVDSDYVNGSDQRLVKIVLGGLMGPVTVDGEEWNLVMPPLIYHPTLSDENLAAVLTYVRREWGHTADPVSPETVALQRDLLKDRNVPWTIVELDGKSD